MSAWDLPAPDPGPFNGRRNGIWYCDGKPDPNHVREVAIDRAKVAHRYARFHLSLPEALAVRELHESRIYREHAR